MIAAFLTLIHTLSLIIMIIWLIKCIMYNLFSLICVLLWLLWSTNEHKTKWCVSAFENHGFDLVTGVWNNLLSVWDSARSCHQLHGWNVPVWLPDGINNPESLSRGKNIWSPILMCCIRLLEGRYHEIYLSLPHSFQACYLFWISAWGVINSVGEGGLFFYLNECRCDSYVVPLS